MSTTTPAAVMILAAGAGTRMKSATPKVLHPIAGRSLIHHAIAAAQGLHPQRLVVVVRHDRDAVVAHVSDIAPEVLIADQDVVPGTGRAVACGLSTLDATAVAAAVAAQGSGDVSMADVTLSGPVVVTSGDVPLVTTELLTQLLDTHLRYSSAATVLTATVEDPTGYGRILRDGEHVVGIVEDADATEQQRAIAEINAGIYVFDAHALRSALTHVSADNAQGEIYLTDVLSIVRAAGGTVAAHVAPDPHEVEGVNDRVHLAAAARRLNNRIVEHWMREGVTVVDPQTTWIDSGVHLEPDVTVWPGTHLRGATTVASGASIGPDTTLEDVTVGPQATVVRTQATQSVIGARCEVGPFSYLRPGTHLGDDGKIGAYVETKNATLGDGAKVPHLSYVGDATVGEGTNIGAGTIVANYDGVSKHHTTIGSHVRIGSDNTLIAPVTIGDGAYTGAGSTVRRDVPAGALAINTAPQQNIDGWVERRRPGTTSAHAARDASAAESSQSPDTDPPSPQGER